MPVSDPSSGRAFIWLIACVLFISVVAGGGCLVVYMLLPESQIAPWLPVAGVALVCIPWAFWFLTFLYRIFSRVFGYRVNLAIGGGGGGNGGAAKFVNATKDGDVEAAGQENGKKETAVGEEDDHRGLNRTTSVASHESEMPLANSTTS